MGWLSDLWDKIVTWFETWLGYFVQSLQSMFSSWMAELKYWKHKILAKVAEWLKNDWVFLGTVVVLLTGAIFLPQLSAWIKGLTIYAMVKKAWETLSSAFRAVFDARIMIDLKAMSDLLKVIWPAWKSATDSMNAIIAGWAEELGQGSGFIHAYFAAAYSLHAGALAVLGVPPETAGIMWYERAAERTRLIDERFRRYVEHPEKIFSDIIEEWLIPTAAEESAAHAATAESLRSAWERIKEIEGGAVLMKESIDSFIEALPYQLRGEFEARWNQFSDLFDDTIGKFREDIGGWIDGIMTALEERDRRLDGLQAQLDINARSPLPLIAAAEDWSEEEKNLFAEFVYASVLRASARAQAEGVEESMIATDDSLERLHAALSGIVPTPTLTYEPTGIVVTPAAAEAVKEDWFVGEF